MGDSSDIKLLVLTPERQVLEETADAVVIPAHDGELGILRDRAALVCELGTGQLRYTRGGTTRRLFVDRGFAQVANNHVTVLTGEALRAEEVTAEVVAAASRAVEQCQGLAPQTQIARQQAQRRLSVLRSIHGTT